MSEIQLPLFQGKTFDEDRDGKRLSVQLVKVRRLMADGLWRTLAEIAEATGAPEASVSARLRDMRKPGGGGYIVEREFVHRGLFRYRAHHP